MPSLVAGVSTAKVIFAVPNNSLVPQQRNACLSYLPIAKELVASLTGATAPDKRPALWESHRLFFATPQTVNNDIQDGVCPASAISCVVIDEAHQAQGDHAYCLLVRLIRATTKHFRVLALTASPGEGQLAIQNVMINLLISRVELRTETDADVAKYINNTERQLEKLDLTPRLEDLKRKFAKVLQIPLEQLHRLSVITNPDVSKVRSVSLALAIPSSM